VTDGEEAWLNGNRQIPEQSLKYEPGTRHIILHSIKTSPFRN